MLKKTFAVVLTISTLLALGACSLIESNTTETESEVVTTADTTEVTTELESTEETTLDENGIMTDEEAIKLCIAGQDTVYSWASCYISADMEGGIFRELGEIGVVEFKPVSKDTYAVIDPDIRGNTKIYYGDYDWMQENLRTVYSERYIEKHFNYKFPWPFIYENGTVYYYRWGDGSGRYQADVNFTVIHKTEDELHIIYESYPISYYTKEIEYDKDSYLGYMSFVKEGSQWLIDAYMSTEIIGFIDDDKVPAKFIDKVPEKYRDSYWYFEE